jgi:hypothetical protein
MAKQQINCKYIMLKTEMPVLKLAQAFLFLWYYLSPTIYNSHSLPRRSIYLLRFLGYG